MNRSFREHAARRQELEESILQLIQRYEDITGWRVTQVEYQPEGGRVIAEGVPVLDLAC